MKTTLPTIWYENEAGERFIPNVELAGDDVPEGFIYQHSRFPLVVRHSVLRAVLQHEVDACSHPDTKPDFGIIDTMEGRECLHCRGYQSKMKGDPWPDKWEANGTHPICAFDSSANDELVTAMVRCGMMASQAMMLASLSCERCMNALAYRFGLSWGYPLGSAQYQKCITACELCE